jgi:hypothetical protein
MRHRLSSLLVGMLAALVASAAASARSEDAPPLLRNPSFEETGPGVPGWELSEGARNGDTDQRSEVAADREFVRAGAASLRLSGGMGTTSWQLVRQKVTVAPGQRVGVRVAARSVNVRREGRQHPNAHAMLEFVDEKGARIDLAWSPVVTGTREWVDVGVSRLAPERTAAVWVGLFLSQSGTLWFDDVRVTVAPGTAADPAGCAAAFDAVEDHLRATYPFFGLGRKPAADALFAKWRERCVAAAGEAAFVQTLRAMLGELDDLHVWLRHGKTVLGTAVATTLRPNLDPAARRAVLTEVLEEKPSLVGRIATQRGPVGYVEIPTWRLDDAAVARLEASLDALADCRALVLDVRANAGGDEALAQRVASRFAAADVVYARSRVRDPLSVALTDPVDRVLPARKGAAADRRPVAVLQGPWCMSSCEGFLLMARALPTVTTVGARSRGASGNPKAFTVLPDLVLHASTWRTFPPGSDETIEGRGVEPEVEVTEVPGGGKDPVLARALGVLE